MGWEVTPSHCFKFKLPIFLQVQLKGGLGGGEWDYALTRTASDIRVRPQGCRPLAADANSESGWPPT